MDQVANLAPLPIGRPMYQMDAQHTGRSPHVGPRQLSLLRTFDTSQRQRTLPVLLGERWARLLNRTTVAAMYVITVAAIGTGSLTVFALVVFAAAPRAVRALQVMSRPAPDEPPAGYVGWPLWYHRVCLVHHRAFGWLFILGLAGGAVFPDVRIG